MNGELPIAPPGRCLRAVLALNAGTHCLEVFLHAGVSSRIDFFAASRDTARRCGRSSRSRSASHAIHDCFSSKVSARSLASQSISGWREGRQQHTSWTDSTFQQQPRPALCHPSSCESCHWAWPPDRRMDDLMSELAVVGLAVDERLCTRTSQRTRHCWAIE
jgi:hypothetical protein